MYLSNAKSKANQNQQIHIKQGCQFSDFSLISDFFRIKECGMKLIKDGKIMDKILIVSKDRLDSGKGLDNPSLKTVYKH